MRNATQTPREKDFLLTVLIPVFNEEGNIEPLLDRLLPILKPFKHEIIFINDGSRDSTAHDITQACVHTKNIKLISFVRNFGHQTALTAGYAHAQGDVVISIDADLQDPPELIHDMIQAWKDGSAVVYAQRAIRNESPFKTLTAKAFYKLIDTLSDTPIPQNVGDYRLIDREVVDMLNNMPEKARFLRGLVAWGGFPATYIQFTRHEREIGETHYPLRKMLSLAIDGIISFSSKPLRFASFMGFLAAAVGLLGSVYAIYRRFFLPQQYWVEGWTATFVGIMFFGGVQLLTIGIIGEYIARIYAQIQNRPNYLIKETVNF